MYERKQQVIKSAHQLFIEKGYQATSIQDILDCSGISKGTFYNYFSSKSELLKAIFVTIHKKYESQRNELLIGENLADFNIFIKQVTLRMHAYKQNKLFTLIEEVLFSNDEDLKSYIKRYRIFELRWLYNRFCDLFGENYQPYLLDSAIMFSGILQHTFHYHTITNLSFNESEVIQYCVDRIKTIVEDVSLKKIQLLSPEHMKEWLPDCLNHKQDFKDELLHNITIIKKELTTIQNADDQKKFNQLLDFIQEELLLKDSPRGFLIESAILSLKSCSALNGFNELLALEKLLND